jgi:hypothetical protein
LPASSVALDISSLISGLNRVISFTTTKTKVQKTPLTLHLAQPTLNPNQKEEKPNRK